MNSRIRPSISWVLALLLACTSTACTTVHDMPQGGTETGNPPVIDASLIALDVRQAEVHVIGRSGAVSPGADVEVISLPSGAVFRGRAAGDGSFDVAVEVPATATFQVRAVSGGRSSGTVHVVNGGASAGEGSGEKLSCAQREQLANAQMHATAEAADTACERDEDCVLTPVNTLCNDACSDAPVSTGGVRDLQEARMSIETGLCKDFRSDGCSFLVLPCVPPTSTSVGCRDRRCQLIEPEPQTSADCSSDFDYGTGPTANGVAVYGYYARAGVCATFAYTGEGGNGNRYATPEACEAACSRSRGACPPNRVETTLCVEGGLSGGCARSATGCALLCSTAQPASCEGEPLGWWCNGSFCDATAPL